MSARYRHLTTRQDNPLTDGQARAAIAAALLRWLHVIIDPKGELGCHHRRRRRSCTAAA